MVHGFGTMDVKIIGGVKENPHYGTWSRMIERCYSNSSLSRHPQYMGVTVCEEWAKFSNFQDWAIENYVEGWALDKDMIDLRGVVYSPETCCYLPQELNKAILDSFAMRSKWGTGVWYKKPSRKMTSERKRPFIAEINNKKIGQYRTPEEAHKKWQSAKVEQLIFLAKSWFGKIDDRAILGLVKRAYLIELAMKNKTKTLSVSRMEEI